MLVEDPALAALHEAVGPGVVGLRAGVADAELAECNAGVSDFFSTAEGKQPQGMYLVLVGHWAPTVLVRRQERRRKAPSNLLLLGFEVGNTFRT